MLRTTIATKTLDTGTEVPPDVMTGTKRASEILEAELGELAEKFNLAAEWRFSQWPDGPVIPHVRLTADGTLALNLSFPPGTLKNEEAILRNLRPALNELGRYLSGLIQHRLDALRKKLDEDLEALTALAKE
ncbi:MAG: hypothetical protein L0241_10500 [Planctomycetia bacterium]|nr:hypothetical protein [Planctomycetia bacterium]